MGGRIDKPALPHGRGEKRGGIGLTPKNAAPRTTARSKTFGRLPTSQRPPTPRWVGTTSHWLRPMRETLYPYRMGGHQRDGGGAQGRPPMHAASGLSSVEERGPKLGRSSHRRRGRLGWRGGEPARRANRMFFLLWCETFLGAVSFVLSFWWLGALH